MLKEGIHGFCMALADSVPGVSGGTVAFVMGFYDRFIGSIHDLAFGNRRSRKEAVVYLGKLGVGWVVGMALAAAVLSALFERHIYMVSSLFLGLIAGSIPLVVGEEKESFREVRKGVLFGVLGLAVVVGITWVNGRTAGASVDLVQLSVPSALKLFGIGMAAVCAMFLPGISGSTLLLIFGAYLPVIMAVRGLMSLEFSYFPGLCCFGWGIAAGALSAVKVIRIGLEKYRPQMVYLILGMMLGSFYAIVMGPTALEIPQAPLSLRSFHIPAAVVGAALVWGMQMVKDKSAAAGKHKKSGSHKRQTKEEGLCR